MRGGVLVVLGGLLVGCAGEPEPLPFDTTGTVRELMAYMVDPAADLIWDAVGTVVTAEGVDHWEPSTDEEWRAVRFGALTVTESANLLMMGSRVRDEDMWIEMSRDMMAAGREAIAAADARDADRIFDLGEVIYETCNNCHAIYWVGDADRGRVQVSE